MIGLNRSDRFDVLAGQEDINHHQDFTYSVDQKRGHDQRVSDHAESWPPSS